MADQVQRLRQRQSATHPLQTIPVNHEPHGNIPNTPLGVAAIAFLLGSVFSLGALTFALGGFKSFWWSTYQLGFFVASWAFFHWAEFAVTAGWNLEKCSIDSFLLDNGSMYHIANGTALLEYLITLYLRPDWKTHAFISVIGMASVLFGQTLRSAAMAHASTNFSHSLATYKRESHKLVTDGVYNWFRHPSYAGFFYWALGTQLVLQNPFSFVLFFVLLWRFFHHRTRGLFSSPSNRFLRGSITATEEEKSLVKFFGDEYIQYRRRVGTRIPFIP